MVFFELLLDVWGLSRVTRGTQRAFGVAPRKYNLNSSCKWECGIALESQQGNLAQDSLKGVSPGPSQVATGNPGVPLACDRDLRELFRVPMGSQDYCGVGRSHSVLHWLWCNGRGPQL